MGLKLFHSIWTESAMNVVRCGKIQDHKARMGSFASIITNLNVYTHDKILSLVLHIILKLEWNYVHYILELTFQSHFLIRCVSQAILTHFPAIPLWQPTKYCGWKFRDFASRWRRPSGFMVRERTNHTDGIVPIRIDCWGQIKVPERQISNNVL